MTEFPLQHSPHTLRSLDRDVLLALLPALILQIKISGVQVLAMLVSGYLLVMVLATAGFLAMRRRQVPPWQDTGYLVLVAMFTLLLPGSDLLPALLALSLASLLTTFCLGGIRASSFHPAMLAVLLLWLLQPTAVAAPLQNIQEEKLRDGLLCLAALVLLLRGSISWRIPLGSAMFLLLLFVLRGSTGGDLAERLLAFTLQGHLILLIFFIAPHTGSSGSNSVGAWCYGALLAVFYYLSLNQPAVIAASLSVLLANFCAPLIDRLESGFVAMPPNTPLYDRNRE